MAVNEHKHLQQISHQLQVTWMPFLLLKPMCFHNDHWKTLQDLQRKLRQNTPFTAFAINLQNWFFEWFCKAIQDFSDGHKTLWVHVSEGFANTKRVKVKPAFFKFSRAAVPSIFSAIKAVHSDFKTFRQLCSKGVKPTNANGDRRSWIHGSVLANEIPAVLVWTNTLETRQTFVADAKSSQQIQGNLFVRKNVFHILWIFRMVRLAKHVENQVLRLPKALTSQGRVVGC